MKELGTRSPTERGDDGNSPSKVRAPGSYPTGLYADGVLDKFEDYLMRRLVKLLGLSHSQMIEAKVKVLDEVGRENIRPGT